MHELLTPAQMAIADKTAINSGIEGITLMQNAGEAVANVALGTYPSAKSAIIICGTGNNGGDGFIAAQVFQRHGLKVDVIIVGDASRIEGDAKIALTQMDQGLLISEMRDLNTYDLIIDALFGAGLDRDVTGIYEQLITQMNNAKSCVVSVDLPSGINGETGEVMGLAVNAKATATFFRYKPGHILLPGKDYCGDLSLHDIGIASNVLEKSGYIGLCNSPDWWSDDFPYPTSSGHKYTRGHCLVMSGPAHATGASRLAASGALRSGAGLVTVASPQDAINIHAAHLTSVMLLAADNTRALRTILEDKRINCVALGPGMPPDQQTRESVLAILETGRDTVLDAGALSAFQHEAAILFKAIKDAKGDVYLTPHDGEFNALFGAPSNSASKVQRALDAAQQSGGIIVLKGADTIVATPQGQVSICNSAPAWLATAGSGDVLTGIIAGLVTQGMPAFLAASAAVWLHAEAANIIGAGMISSDLDEGLRLALKALITKNTTP